MMEEWTMDREVEKKLQEIGIPQGQIDALAEVMEKTQAVGVRIKKMNDTDDSFPTLATPMQRVVHALFKRHRPIGFGSWDVRLERFVHKQICVICGIDL